MIGKMKWLVVFVLISSIILSGCAKTPSGSDLETQLSEKVTELENVVIENNDLKKTMKKLQNQVEEFQAHLTGQPESMTLSQPGPSANVLLTSLAVIELIKDKDMTSLSSYIHPAKGLRLTPYFYIDTQNDQVFTAAEVAALGQNTNVFTWGEYDGRGHSIDLTFSDYYDEFIYDEDFSNPHIIGNNVPVGSGNMTDNKGQVYPNSHFVEFHFTGFDPQFEGLDWRSLRLVFEQDNGLWYLAGIIHGQWTV